MTYSLHVPRADRSCIVSVRAIWRHHSGVRVRVCECEAACGRCVLFVLQPARACVRAAYYLACAACVFHVRVADPALFNGVVSG